MNWTQGTYQATAESSELVVAYYPTKADHNPVRRCIWCKEVVEQTEWRRHLSDRHGVGY